MNQSPGTTTGIPASGSRLPVATAAGGEAIASPDVCIRPESGGPFPYENHADLAAASGVASRVLVENKPILVVGSVIPKSWTVPSGAGAGLVSGTSCDCVRVKGGSSKVFVQGRRAAMLGSRTVHNGRPANAPNGKIVKVAQDRVVVAT